MISAEKPAYSIDLIDGLSLSVTGYAGHEEEVLKIRNENRSNPKTRAYLDWRYKYQYGCLPARIFWLRNCKGQAEGMAAIIYRRYMVDGKPANFSVLGDISLAENLRKKGIGRQMLQFATRFIEEQTPDCPGVVIPTTAAMRSLDAIGWRVTANLTPHVCLLNPEEKLFSATRNRRVAQKAAAAYKSCLSLIQRHRDLRGFELEHVDQIDDAFNLFWEKYDKQDLILLDRNTQALKSRYIDHPDYDFKIAKLLNHDVLAGYVIYELNAEDATCHIYDLIANRPQDELEVLLALFIKYCLSQKSVNTIRFVTNDRHPYNRKLWRMGFIPRKHQIVFQVYWPKPMKCKGSWLITLGDKDI